MDYQGVFRASLITGAAAVRTSRHALEVPLVGAVDQNFQPMKAFLTLNCDLSPFEIIIDIHARRRPRRNPLAILYLQRRARS
mmetsp:Transcript_4858/g.14393  ORF Transcript_4858/g.14393 Transcript_4858/m.14393 type:complete len:82 (-) Transcript_4858:306-551(-)